MLLLLASTAWAHVPHDNVLGLAPAPGLDPDSPWWLVADHEDVADLYRSDDAGRTWQGAAGACLDHKLSAIAQTLDGEVAVLGDGSYWWTADGFTWEEVALPVAARTMIGGHALRFATDEGIAEAVPGQVPTLVAALGPVVRLFEGADGAVGVLESGALAWEREDGWQRIEVAEMEVFGASSAPGRLYAGLKDGRIWRFDEGGAWTACGDSPLAGWNPDHAEVVRLHSDGRDLVAAHADYGPILSEDDCASWTAHGAPIEIEWPEEETPSYTTTPAAFTALMVGQGSIVLAGYDGAARWDGASWSHAPLKGPDYHRGVAFSRDFAVDGKSLVPSYGCGVVRSFGWGASWDCPGRGFDVPGSQSVTIPADAQGLVPAFALLDRIPFRSDDEGATWQALSGPWEKVRKLVAGREGRLWAIGILELDLELPGVLARSTDGGQSFEALPAFTVTGELPINGVLDLDGVLAFWTTEAVYLSEDLGETLVEAYRGLDIVEVAALSLPTGPRLLVAEQEGLRIVEAGGENWATLPGPARIRRIEADPSGVVVAASRAQQLWWSMDGGLSWTDPGGTVPTQVEALDLHPDPLAFPEAVVSTPSGAYLARPDGRVSRWAGYQRADDYTEFLVAEPALPQEERADAALGWIRPMPAGSAVEIWLRGSALHFWGESLAEATGDIEVDGHYVAGWSTGPVALPGLLAQVEGLEDRLHLVRFSVTTGELALDAVDATGQGELLGHDQVDETDDSASPPAPSGSGEGCGGCGGGPPGGIAGLVTALLAMRRARRPTPRPPSEPVTQT